MANDIREEFSSEVDATKAAEQDVPSEVQKVLLDITGSPGPESTLRSYQTRTKSKQIETKELYPLSQTQGPELSNAFKLLEEGLNLLDLALKSEKEADMLGSDDAINRLQALLPELFCCRKISDGFGAIINSVYHSIQNLEGAPLNANQIYAIKKILNRISTEPFLQYDEAVDEIISLEDVGFEVEPRYFKYAADMLDE